MKKNEAKDKNGTSLVEGDWIKLIHLDSGSFPWLEGKELDRVMSMVGSTFKVEDIDETGQVWIHQEWPSSGGQFETDSIGLVSHEFVVSPKSAELTTNKTV